MSSPVEVGEQLLDRDTTGVAIGEGVSAGALDHPASSCSRMPPAASAPRPTDKT